MDDTTNIGGIMDDMQYVREVACPVCKHLVCQATEECWG